MKLNNYGQEKERKKFKIPSQIDKSFHVWRFVTLKEASILVVTALFSVVLWRYILPDDIPFEVKVFSAALPIAFMMAILFITPIKERKNIRWYHKIKWKIDYNKRQKLYFYKKKNGGEY